MDKGAIRQAVWDKLEELNVLYEYPRPCHGKIPRFLGCNAAAYRLARLRLFKNASVVKVNPSMAQMKLRYLVLKTGKTLIVSQPSLDSTDAIFYQLNGCELQSEKQRCKASTKAGAKTLGKSLLLHWEDVHHVDVFVVGSVAVDARNGLRLGKGSGYADLEWAILVELGLVDENTVVVTLVHEQQIVSMPPSLQQCHDLPVDIIVTPERVIHVKRKLAKPMAAIMWDLVDQETLQAIPILQILKAKRVPS